VPSLRPMAAVAAVVSWALGGAHWSAGVLEGPVNWRRGDISNCPNASVPPGFGHLKRSASADLLCHRAEADRAVKSGPSGPSAASREAAPLTARERRLGREGMVGEKRGALTGSDRRSSRACWTVGNPDGCQHFNRRPFGSFGPRAGARVAGDGGRRLPVPPGSRVGQSSWAMSCCTRWAMSSRVARTSLMGQLLGSGRSQSM